MRRRLLTLLSPLVLLLVVEIALRCGVWERYA